LHYHPSLITENCWKLKVGLASLCCRCAELQGEQHLPAFFGDRRMQNPNFYCGWGRRANLGPTPEMDENAHRQMLPQSAPTDALAGVTDGLRLGCESVGVSGLVVIVVVQLIFYIVQRFAVHITAISAYCTPLS
jgi:hypothetical protein